MDGNFFFLVELTNLRDLSESFNSRKTEPDPRTSRRPKDIEGHAGRSESGNVVTK